MKVLILPTPEAATARTPDILEETLAARPEAVLGLATGGTMLPLCAELVARHRAGRFSLARATSFNLDEYLGLPPSHPGSYHRYMARALFEATDMREDHAHLPRGDAPDPQAEAPAYEARIDAAGGFDLQLLGIGRNGHIGFNEPTSSLGSRTRVKTLTESTRAANRRYFDSDAAVPRFAITMGIATILKSRACLLLATGRDKAEAVAAMVEGRFRRSARPRRCSCIGRRRSCSTRRRRSCGWAPITTTSTPAGATVSLAERPAQLLARRLFPGGGGRAALADMVVEIAGARIAGLRAATAAEAAGALPAFDIVAPGFIDLQINGAGGGSSTST